MLKKIIFTDLWLKIFAFLLVFSGFFPAIRVLLIGGKAMQGFAETIITVFPDLLAATLACIAIIIYLEKKKQETISVSKFDYLVAAFFIFNVGYGFLISDKDYIAFLSFRVTYFSILFYFFARLFQNHKLDDLSKYIHYVFYGFVVLAVAGLILYFIFPYYQIKLIVDSGSVIGQYFIVRMTSFVLTPVVYAAIIAFACVYFYIKALSHSNMKHLIVFFILWLCLLFSVSRGATIAFMASFIFISCIMKNLKITSIAFIGMMVILIAVSFYATQSFLFIKWMCYSAANTINMDGDLTRVNRWQVTYDDFIRKPMGYGFGKTGAVAYRYFIDKPNVEAAEYSTDGWYLKMACETGVMGILSFVVLIFTYFFTVIKSVIQHKQFLSLLAIGLFAFVGVQCIVSNTLDFYPLTLLYWFIIGLSINIYQKSINA